MLSKTGEIRRDESCLDYSGSDVILYPCHGSKGNQQWIYNSQVTDRKEIAARARSSVRVKFALARSTRKKRKKRKFPIFPVLPDESHQARQQRQVPGDHGEQAAARDGGMLAERTETEVVL